MQFESKRTNIFIIITLTITFIVGSYIIFTQEISNIENVTSSKAIERAHQIKEKMALIHSFIHTMNKNMQDYTLLQSNEQQHHPALSLIKDYPEFNVSGIDDSKGQFAIGGAFSAIHDSTEYDLSKKQEISAAFYLKSTYLSALSSIPDLKWVYYLSKKQFVYMVPYLPISTFRLGAENYQKDYWVKALPENNPNRRLVMTNVYEDGAGKGKLATFSMPIYLGDEFKGIIGIDVSLDVFETIMSMNSILGDSFLLDENNMILASDSNLSTMDRLLLPTMTIENYTVVNHSDGYDYFSLEIVANEVRFVHRLNRDIKFDAALLNSIRELFLLLSSVVMAYMIYYFRVLIFRVGKLANTDPLTGLLNRRAMENAVLPLLSISERYDQKMCFLLADIDDFKIVNDSYGHIVGDELLISVTSILNSCLRSSDLVSRHGGEEFLIVLPQTDHESGALLAERIRTSIENTRTGELKVAVTLSIGCAEIIKDESYDTAITRADHLLYKAKTNGRNQTVTTL